MVKHLNITRGEINEELRTIEMRIHFGGFCSNRNEEYDYFWKKFDEKKVEVMAKKYFKFSELDCEGNSCGFGFGSIEFKFWDIKMKSNKEDLTKLQEEIQEYINLL